MHTESSPHPSFDALTPTQKQAVLSRGSLGVIAGPGAGKTTMLAHAVLHSIASGWAAPEQHLMLTFTNRATNEMLARLPATQASSVAVTTLHSFCLNQIVRPFRELLGYAPAQDESGKQSAVSVVFGERRRAHILAAQTHVAQQWPGVVERLDADAIGQAISAYKSSGLSPAEALSSAQDEVRAFMARIYAEYQARLVRDRVEDADGLILGAYQILSQSREARDFVHAQFKRIYVDEAQDFSLLQWRVLKLLAEGATLMIVGDHLQSVYGFRQAVGAEIFNLFQREIAEAELLVLAENQRSRAPIVAVANSLFGAGVRMQTSVRGDGPPVYVLQAASEHEQSRLVVQQVKDAIRHGGVPARGIAILARAKRHIEQIERGLISADVAYRIPERGGFWEEVPVRHLRAILELTQPGIAGLCDNLALRQALAIPQLGLSEALCAQLRADEPELLVDHLFDDARLGALGQPDQARVGVWLDWLLTLQSHANANPADVLAWILDASEGMGYSRVLDLPANSARHWPLVRELMRLAGRHSTVRGFLDSIALSSGDDVLAPGEADRVTLATLHAVKGLEFSVVFLIGVNEGQIPHFGAAASKTALEEEQRMLYVGMTRPRDLLCLMLARTRQLADGRHEPLGKSRFLANLAGPIEARSAPAWPSLKPTLTGLCAAPAVDPLGAST